MAAKRRTWVVCIRNGGYEVSLERRKIYEVIPDTEAESHDQLRVIDESNEDYLFPASYFATIELPAAVRRALAASNRPLQPTSGTVTSMPRTTI